MGRRVLVASITVCMGMLIVAPSEPASSTTPVAKSEAEYIAYGRVFPDPHGCHQGEPGASPWAKGRVCAVDFIQLRDIEDGLRFLASLEVISNFVEVYQLDEDFACDGSPVAGPADGCKEFRSIGLPVTASEGEPVTRERLPLYMVRVTDESVPNENKDYFVFPLSIHGIERQGVEGGTRAIEDLATWAACERSDELDVCSEEGPIPHSLLEATPKRSVTAGEALKKAVIYFIYPNPDGWYRGERTSGGGTYQRFNGNGMDLNRDWPELGYTYRPYTPWSEPESRAFGKVLQAIGPTDENGRPKWTGGIDLHGQGVARSYSFTLLGGSERPYDKDQRILQTVKGAWSDAEKKLAWSPLIKPNDAPDSDPRQYGVQWGTIWDTLDYTITGALGNWIDSPLGLNADGIDNEMSFSPLVAGYEPDTVQLWIDGNKSLVYSMINYSLIPEDNTFETTGKVAYVHNKGFVAERTDRLVKPPRFTRLPPQEDILDVTLDPTNDYTHQFDVLAPPKHYNGGIAVTITCANVQGGGACALNEARLERKVGQEWELVASYFNQGATFMQAGQGLHANLPTPGPWRVRIVNDPAPTEASGVFRADIEFTKEKGWPDPGQIGYRATNMRFWQDLKPFTRPRIEKITPKQVATRGFWKKRYDTIVITNKMYPKLATKLRRWVARQNGNLVLTDAAITMLEPMKIVAKGSVLAASAYAGYVNFATKTRANTYDDPLAHKINQPGAAEGRRGREIHRRQTYEPVPLGISIQTPDGGQQNNSPVWYVTLDQWRKARGKQRAVATTVSTENVSLGQIGYLGGRIRVLGAVLPMPSKQYDNPFGVGDYGLTYAGYQLLQNLLTWERP